MPRLSVSMKAPVIVLMLFSISMAVYAQGSRDSRVGAQPAGRINGEVKLPNGQPAQQVIVSCDAWSGGIVGQVRTDSSGRFQFDSLGPSQFTVSIRQPGYLP